MLTKLEISMYLKQICLQNILIFLKTTAKNTVILILKQLLPEKKNNTNTFKTIGGAIGEKQINWSDRPCIGYSRVKIILGHKMYGYPLLDLNGEYGISNRDNYIITEYNVKELQIIEKFLSTFYY